MSLDTQCWLLALRTPHESNGCWGSLLHISFQAGGRKVEGQTCHFPGISHSHLYRTFQVVLIISHISLVTSSYKGEREI